MIVKALRGRGFVGAIAYVTHDAANAKTAHRVDWTLCDNLATNNPTRAANQMAWTATHADDLKRAWNAEHPDQAISMKGRKCERPVYHLILSWAPDETPDRTEMEKAASAALSSLGLERHERVLAAHKDSGARHLHVIVNLIHPESGKAASLSNDRHRLQAWALAYEQAQGRIRCEQREENAKARAQGETVLDLASRNQDKKVKGRKRGQRIAEARSLAGPFDAARLPACSLSLRARFQVRVDGAAWRVSMHDRIVTPEASRTLRVEFATEAGRGQWRVDVTPSSTNRAQDLRPLQREREAQLRETHKGQWEAHRTHWDRQYRITANRLHSDAAPERARLKEENRERFRAARRQERAEIVAAVKAQFSPRRAAIKATHRSLMDTQRYGLHPRLPGRRALIAQQTTGWYAALKAEQAAAVANALNAHYRASTRENGSPPSIWMETAKRDAEAARATLRARHEFRRSSELGQLAAARNAAKSQLIANQQTDRATLADLHRREWGVFNGRRAAWLAQRDRSDTGKRSRATTPSLSFAEQAAQQRILSGRTNKNSQARGRNQTRKRPAPS